MITMFVIRSKMSQFEVIVHVIIIFWVMVCFSFPFYFKCYIYLSQMHFNFKEIIKLWFSKAYCIPSFSEVLRRKFDNMKASLEKE